MEEKKFTINASEEELNLLFRELLDGCRDDIEEAKSNVEQFFEAIDDNKNNGLSIYGQLYNESLKIKGDARDRQLKLLNMFRDRVSTKEKLSLVKKEETYGALPSQAEMTKVIEEIEKNKKLKPINIEPTILEKDTNESLNNQFEEHEIDVEDEDEILEDE